MRPFHAIQRDLDSMDAFNRRPGNRPKIGGRGGKMSLGSNPGGKSKLSRAESIADSTRDAAIFNIVVTRATANIAATTLPFAMFASNWIENAYNGIINSVSGATLVVKNGINGAVGNTATFTYTAGGNTDIVSVQTTAGAAYPAFLSALKSRDFRVSKIRMSLSDSSQLTQFDQSLNYFYYSMFGKQDVNSIPVPAFKYPDQQQNSIIDIPFVGTINGDRGFASSIIAVAAFSVTYSIFVEEIG